MVLSGLISNIHSILSTKEENKFIVTMSSMIVLTSSVYVGILAMQYWMNPKVNTIVYILLVYIIFIYVIQDIENDSISLSLLPALTENETIEILTKIAEKSKLLTARMANAAMNIKQQINQQGQDLDQSIIMKNYILPHYTTEYESIVNTIYTSYDVQDDEVEDACNEYYESNKKIQDLMKNIKKCYQSCGGEVIEDDIEYGYDMKDISTKKVSKDVSFEDVIEILSIFAQLSSQRTDEFIETFKSKYGIPCDQTSFENFQQGIITLTDE